MGTFASGKHALAISDRSGLAFPWREMVTEWNGAFVHFSEYEPKQPQLRTRPHGADPQSLPKVRPARTEFYVPTILPNNPFTTTVGTTVTVTQDDHGRSTGDIVRFRNIVQPVGGVTAAKFMLESTLSADITASVTSLTLADSTAFPSIGYIVINEALNDNETIYYGANDTGTGILSSLTRGTSAQTYNLSPLVTTANSHSSGAKVAGSFSITKIDDNSYSFILASAATVAETGGGFEGFAGPVNTRA